MDPNSHPSAPAWNPGEKSGMDQPPPYQDCIAGYHPPPGTYPPSQYPQGLPYGAPYAQPGQHANEGQFQPLFAAQPIVTVQPTVYVTPTPLAQPFPDYLGYSIFTLLCCCLPLGVAALVFSVNTRDANAAGNRLLAERNSRLARTLNNTALGIGIAFIIIYFIIVAI